MICDVSRVACDVTEPHGACAAALRLGRLRHRSRRPAAGHEPRLPVPLGLRAGQQAEAGHVHAKVRKGLRSVLEAFYVEVHVVVVSLVCFFFALRPRGRDSPSLSSLRAGFCVGRGSVGLRIFLQQKSVEAGFEALVRQSYPSSRASKRLPSFFLKGLSVLLLARTRADRRLCGQVSRLDETAPSMLTT